MMTLTWVHPKPHHHTAEASTLVLGQWQGQGGLWLNGQSVPLSPSGFFALAHPLQEGSNTLRFESEGVLLAQRPVERVPSLKAPAQGFDTRIYPLPQPCAVGFGGTIPLSLLGAGTLQQVQARLMNPKTGCSMAQSTLVAATATTTLANSLGHHTVWDTRQAIFGALHWREGQIPLATGPHHPSTLWQGQLTVPHLALPHGTPLTLVLEGTDTQGETHHWELPEAVTWHTSTHWATLQHPTPLRANALEGQRWGNMLPAGTPLQLLGQQGAYSAVALGAQRAWVLSQALGDCYPCHEGTLPCTPLQVAHVTYAPTEGRFALRLPLTHKVAAWAQMSPQGQHSTLTLHLPHVALACDVVSYTPEAAQALDYNHNHHQPLTLHQSDPQLCQVQVPWPPHGCGYSLAWEDDPLEGQTLVLQWHVLPPTAKELRVWLDVGHGGDETGCTALDGSLEKNWNLKAAHLLKQQLLQAGVGHVHLGRHGDTTQSLTQRVEALEASACHISLSLHFNALPCGRDPMAHEGLGVYYYQPWAWAWASNLLKAASQTGLRVDSVFENNLALTRPSGCVALLVEFGYLIHPHTLEALLEPNSQLLEQWAQALTHGLITQFEAAAAKASP